MGCLHPKRLADFRAGRLDAAARESVEQHLETCAPCRTADVRVSGSQLALREIAEHTEATASQVGTARIEATLRWTRSNPTYSPRRNWVYGFGAVAAAAAAAVIGWRITRPHLVAPAPSSVAKMIQPPPPAPEPAKALPGEALVTLVGGDAKLARSDGSPAALGAKTRLAAGDRITTVAGGRVGLQWGEGSGALVGSVSDLRLVRLEPRAQDLALLHGQVAVRVGPHQPGESLHVTSPDHRVTVHGTWFIVAAEARGTTIEVLEGVVEVAAREGDGSSTRVSAPQRAFFPRGNGVPVGAHSLSGREALARRLSSEMGLLAAWTSIDSLFGSTGMLEVASTPPASVSVDGVPYGMTALKLRRPRGRHLVELSRPGFATIIRWVTIGDEPGDLRVALLKQDDKPEVTPPAPEEVAEVTRSRRRQISACHEHSLKRDPTIAGTVELEIKIGPAGQVLSTRVNTDTLPDPEIAACLRREAAGWAFRSARNATALFPFVFRTQ